MMGATEGIPAADRRLSVLILEDEPLVALFLQDAIEDAGWTVHGTAASGDEAIGLATRRRPDLAFVDVNLDGQCDGINVAGQLADRFGIRIVLVSGYPDIGTDERVSRLPLVAILQKPCSPEQIQQVLERAQTSG